MIDHVTVLAGEGWSSVARRLCGATATPAQVQTFLGHLWAANGANSKTPLFVDQVLHFHPDELPAAPAAPVLTVPTLPPVSLGNPPAGYEWWPAPVAGSGYSPAPQPAPNPGPAPIPAGWSDYPKGRPFAPNSPWNTPIPDAWQSRWQVPPGQLRWISVNSPDWPDSDVETRKWFGDNGFHIYEGYATDPVWTVKADHFGVSPDSTAWAAISDPWTWNTYWPAMTFTMHAPNGMTKGTDSDMVTVIDDTTTGTVLELGNGSYVIDETTHTITCGDVNGSWWALSNVHSIGIGEHMRYRLRNATTKEWLVGSGTSSGVRAARWGWFAGAVTAWDMQQVRDGKTTDFGHALNINFSIDNYHRRGVVDPITGKAKLDPNGPSLDLLSKWGVVWPAHAPNNADNDGPIPIGSRIGIPKNTPMPADIHDIYGIALWNTLVRYGAFVGDYSGGFWPMIMNHRLSFNPIGTLSKTGEQATLGDWNSMWMWWWDPMNAGVPVGADGHPAPANKFIPPFLYVMTDNR